MDVDAGSAEGHGGERTAGDAADISGTGERSAASRVDEARVRVWVLPSRLIASASAVSVPSVASSAG
jgi:hypothetical protein